jgi:glycosyltransferase involved in cell wall biosynthesis
MRIALIGPTHPYKGGIVHHTTELAHRLHKAGHDVDLLSWSAQYPTILYPGVQKAPMDKPETPPFGRTTYPLSWKNPLGWAKVGRKLRGYDLVVFVFVTSIQAPAYLTMMKSMGRKRHTKVMALCHNVLPHERKFFDVPLTKAVLSRVDQVLVHTAAQADLAHELTKAAVITTEMPPHLPAKPKGKAKQSGKLTHNLFFFGMVRKYKGVDNLLKAVAQVPGVSVTIGGEVWGGTEKYDQLIAELGIKDRVTMHTGYIPSQQIPELINAADALVLPYRSGTATQNIWLAFAHGKPVIATKVGSMAKQVRDSVDGLLCEPDDVNSLAQAIRTFYEPGVAEHLTKNVPPLPEDETWEAYIADMLAGLAENPLKK